MFKYDIKKTVIDYKLAELDKLEKEFKHTFGEIEISKEKLIEYRILTKNGICVKVQLFNDINQLYLYVNGYLDALNYQSNQYIQFMKSMG